MSEGKEYRVVVYLSGVSLPAPALIDHVYTSLADAADDAALITSRIGYECEVHEADAGAPWADARAWREVETARRNMAVNPRG